MVGANPVASPAAAWLRVAMADEVRRTDRLGVLLANRGLRLPERDARPWLGLVARPMVELSRPRDWTAADRAMTTLLDRLDVPV